MTSLTSSSPNPAPLRTPHSPANSPELGDPPSNPPTPESHRRKLELLAEFSALACPGPFPRFTAILHQETGKLVGAGAPSILLEIFHFLANKAICFTTHVNIRDTCHKAQAPPLCLLSNAPSGAPQE